MTLRRAALYGVATGCAIPAAVAAGLFAWGAVKELWGWT